MNTTTNAPRLLRLPDVKRMTGLGRSTIYALIDAGTFPRQRKITPTIAVWSEAEVEAWVARVLADNCAETLAA
ncbi:AlpA family phage regulatory protein [Luteimonas sp. 100069]|uniref:helix-turn-helix transcriptional regulator n=1 Tax=Luteimonas sp. 100069 TaxID=2006109 RepID=UPI000F4EAF0D|nr:AlpA family phage regulatory protein [Luteimonas sp. 100069]RPD88135.1 AlpA family phage regulatory protein [Luteimonas sp. 100069]